MEGSQTNSWMKRLEITIRKKGGKLIIGEKSGGCGRSDSKIPGAAMPVGGAWDRWELGDFQEPLDCGGGQNQMPRQDLSKRQEHVQGTQQALRNGKRRMEWGGQSKSRLGKPKERGVGQNIE